MESIRNDNYPEIILALLIILSTGLNGLIAYFFLFTLSRLNCGKDSHSNHGLVSGNSRLGGVAIICSLIFGTIINLSMIKQLSLSNFKSEMMDLIIFFSLLISSIGLTEDFSQKLSSINRLALLVLMVITSLIFMNEILPLSLNIFNIYNLDSTPIIFVISVVMIVGFINAGNMADGANGLFALIATFFFVMLYSQYESVSFLTLIVGLVSFSLYNIFTGKIFLGDCGSYFLSSLIAFLSLKAYQDLNLPIFLFASFLIYPCFEIVRTILIRFISNAPIMSPDNLHLHNYLNSYYLSLGFRSHIANSLTGITIAISTSIFALFSFFILERRDSGFWSYLFFSEFILLTIIYMLLLKKNIVDKKA